MNASDDRRPLSDDELRRMVERLRQGQAITQREENMMYETALWYARQAASRARGGRVDEGVVGSAAADGFLALVEKYEQERGRASALLRTVCGRRVIPRKVKRQEYQLTDEAAAGLIDRSPPVGHAIEEEEEIQQQRERLERAMAALTELQREAIIAARSGFPFNRGRAYAARARLRSVLGL